MKALRRWLARLGLVSDRRTTGDRIPIFVGARLELDVVEVSGTARDLSPGGVFFQTSAPLAPGVRGLLSRDGSREQIPVRVTWRRPASGKHPGGLGLEFE